MARAARPWPLSLRWVLLLAFGEAAWWLLVDRRHDDFRPLQRQIVGWAVVGLIVYLVFVYARAIVQTVRAPRPLPTPESRDFFRLSALRAALLLAAEIAVAVVMART